MRRDADIFGKGLSAFEKSLVAVDPIAGIGEIASQPMDQSLFEHSAVDGGRDLGNVIQNRLDGMPRVLSLCAGREVMEVEE